MPLTVPQIIFLTAHEPADRRDWNTAITDGLKAAGIRIVILQWTDEAVLYKLASLSTHICLLSTAYYNQHMDSFTRLLTETLPEIKRQHPSIRICNTSEHTLWNSSKTCLLDLQAAGFLLPRTALLADADLSTFTSPVIIKPTVGASGVGVRKIDIDDLEGIQLPESLVQEFIPEISDGELSLVYINHEHIATAIKRPVKGEYRINTEHGGTASALPETPQPAKDVGMAVLNYLRRFGRCAYLRLDGIMRGDTFIIMEVECIEPSLTFGNEDIRTKVIQAFKTMFTSDLNTHT